MANTGDRHAFVLRGDELRRMRLSVGLSQRDLAARLAYSPAQVCAWEQGRSAIPRTVWDAIRREIEQERRARAEWEAFMAGLHLPPLSPLLIYAAGQIVPVVATAAGHLGNRGA